MNDDDDLFDALRRRVSDLLVQNNDLRLALFVLSVRHENVWAMVDDLRAEIDRINDRPTR